MKKVAILLDGGFVQHRVKELMGLQHYPDAETIYNFALSFLQEDEEIFRIFFYHGEPYGKPQMNPLSQETFEFSETKIFEYTTDLFKSLATKDYIALRKGETAFRGWKLKPQVIRKLSKQPKDSVNEITAKDLSPELEQKSVDLKIGLDVAWLASNNIVDKIILVTGDSDFVPAMKFARREGMQVVLSRVGPKPIKENLLEHSDVIREVVYKDNEWKME